MRRKLLGPHLAGQWANKLEALRQWQPPFVLVLQPETDKIQQLRAACPDTIIAGRFYHEDGWYADNIRTRPEEFAHDMHAEIIRNPVTPFLDYVQTNNETNQDWEGIQRLNKFTSQWMHLADESQAYKCAILAFSVGNPDMPYKPNDPAGFDGRMLYWQQVLPSLNYAQAHDHLLLLHAYGYPSMFQPDADWYIYRYERQVQDNLKALGIDKLCYAYGEIGIDRYIVNEKGGYKANTTDQDYTNQLLQWERDLQGQEMLLGGAIFTFGDSGGWGSYDISDTSVASMIAAHYTDNAGDYDNPSAASDEPHQVFIPAVGTGQPTVTAPDLPPREWDSRLDARGVKVVTPDVAPGEAYWRIAKARWYDVEEAKALGPDHHIMIDALTEGGMRMTGLPVRVEWPGDSWDGETESKTGEPYSANYPMSPSRNEFSVRVDDGFPSETLTGIGMGAETPSGFNTAMHTTTGVVFQVAIMPQTKTQQPAEQPPTTIEPTPQPDDKWERTIAFVLREEGDFQNHAADPGNYYQGRLIGTKYGISAKSWAGQYDIPSLTIEQAKQIYFTHYWQASGADKLSWPACLVAMDTAVLHGTGTAQSWIGEVGTNAMAFAAKRLMVYTASENWDNFGAGWVNRTARLLQEASK